MPKKTFYKILILGDAGVGKTSIMRRYTDNIFSHLYKATIGADFLSKQIYCEDKLVTLQIWDTAGQERFQSLGTAFYRGSDGVIFVYDTTNSASFDHIQNWYDEYLVSSGGENSPEKFPFILVGNKSDQTDLFQVTPSKAEQWCKKNHNMMHLRVSAKDCTNIEQAFYNLVMKIIETNRDDNLLEDLNLLPVADLGDFDEEPKKKCMC